MILTPEIMENVNLQESEDAFAPFSELLMEHEARKKVTEFSWDVAINLFERVMTKKKSDMLFIDGRPIDDELYLEEVTVEICREYGLSLLDVISDLILPIGFNYPTLLTSLDELLVDAFKPVSKIIQPKTIIWIEDEYWKDSTTSIVETFIRQLLFAKLEPILMAPVKYFDNEVFSALVKSFENPPGAAESTTSACKGDSVENLDDTWKIFSMLVRLGFLLAIRAKNSSPIIVLHFSHNVAERISAFDLLDLAESEGHKIKFLKNMRELTPLERLNTVNTLVDKLAQSFKSKKVNKTNTVGDESLLEMAMKVCVDATASSENSTPRSSDIVSDENHTDGIGGSESELN